MYSVECRKSRVKFEFLMLLFLNQACVLLVFWLVTCLILCIAMVCKSMQCGRKEENLRYFSPILNQQMVPLQSLFCKHLKEFFFLKSWA